MIILIDNNDINKDILFPFTYYIFFFFHSRQLNLNGNSSYCTMNFTNDNYTVCMCTVLEIIGLIKDAIPTQEPVGFTSEYQVMI